MIEGHTGGEDPPEYWGALAKNRARLLVNFLVEREVPLRLLHAKGVPGGGAKVLVYPFVDPEKERERQAKREKKEKEKEKREKEKREKEKREKEQMESAKASETKVVEI